MNWERAMRGSGFGVLFMVTAIINFYAMGRMCALLGTGNPLASLAYSLGLTGLLVAGFLVRASSGTAFKALFVAVTAVYSMEFAALTLLIPFEIINILFRLPARESGVAILCFVAALTLVSAVNSQRIGVRRVRLPFPFGLRAVQLSDAHIGAVHGARYLARVVERVNALAPDIVLITGDVVSGAAPPGDSRLEGFAGLKARTLMAPGNHEFYEGMDEMEKALPKNIELLRDREADMGAYSIFGADFLGDQGVSGTRILKREFSKPVIVLAHVPQFFDLPDGSVILSGHYHGGQVFPFNFLGRLFIKYFSGVYVKDGITLYVSPGTATWGPPMRFGSTNEITLLELGP